jgi:putative transposase
LGKADRDLGGPRHSQRSGRLRPSLVRVGRTARCTGSWKWIELSLRKFGRWQQRFGKVNEHNGLVPRDHQIEDWERQAIVGFFYEYPLEGYRRLAFMMLDRNLVAVSPSTVYRVLKAAGLLKDRFSRPPRKGKGFVQPL